MPHTVPNMVQVSSEKELHKAFFSLMDTDDLWKSFECTVKDISSCPCPFGEVNLFKKLAAQFECMQDIHDEISSHDIVSQLTEDPATVPVLIRVSHFDSCRLDAMSIIDLIVSSTELHEPTKLEILKLDLFKNLLNASDLDLPCLKLTVKAMKNMVVHATTSKLGRKIMDVFVVDLQKVLKEVENHFEDEVLVKDTLELVVNSPQFLSDKDMITFFLKKKQFQKAVEIVTLLHKNNPEAVGIDTAENILKTINKYLINNNFGDLKLPKDFSEMVRRLMPILADYLKFILKVAKGDCTTISVKDPNIEEHFRCLQCTLRDFFVYGNGLESDYSYLNKHNVLTTALAIFNRTDAEVKKIAHDIVRDFIDIVCFPGSDKFPGRDKTLPTLLLVIKNKKLLNGEISKTVNSYRPYESLAQNCIYYISDRGGFESYPKSYVKAMVKYNAVDTIYNFAANDAENIGYVTSVATCLAGLMISTDFSHSRELAEQVLPCIPFFLEFLTKPSVYKSNAFLTVEITKIVVNMIPKASESIQLNSLLSEGKLFPILTELLVKTTTDPKCSLYCTQVAKIAGNLIHTCGSETLAENMVELFPIMWKLLDLYFDEVFYVIMIQLTTTVAPFTLHLIENTEHAENLLMEVHASSNLDNHKWTACTVPFAWCITRRGTKSKMYDHLCKISVKKFGRAKTKNTLESKQAKVFKFLVSILIDAIENPTPQTMLRMEGITKGLIHMAKNSKSDEEIYALEDLVSPAMWMLERYDHPAIIKNVKEFINIMH